MRKTLSAILIFFFLFDAGGYFIWFRVVQWNIRNEIREKIEKGLKDEELTIIILQAEHSSWLRTFIPEKEFKYKGEMYDVVRTKTIDHQKHYYCLKDTREKHLIDKFIRDNLSKKKVGKFKRIPLKYLHNFSKLQPCINRLIIKIYSIILHYYSRIPETISPPPKTLFQV